MTHRGRVLVLSVCAASALHAQRGGIATQFSRSGDTTIARVNGPVPATAVKRLVEISRIHPTDADTGFFAYADEVSVDRQGRVWVFDSQSNSIFLFEQDGKLVRRIGRAGGGPGEFQGSDGIAIMRDGRLAALDFRSGRVSFFTQTGDFVTSWPVPASSFYGRSSLFTDTTGTLRMEWRATSGRFAGNDVLVALKQGGSGFTRDTVTMPPPIEVPSLTFGVAPRRASMSVPYHGYMHRAWQWNGSYAAADAVTGVISIGQPNGRTVLVERDAPRVAVSSAERAEAEARITFQARRTEPAWSWNGPAIPASKPYFTSLFAARDGRVWVQVAGDAIRIPDSKVREARAGAPPPARWTSATVWEVYGSNGMFLGRIPFPLSGRVVHATGNDVWVAEQTDDGFTAIVRYRIEAGLGN